MLVDVAEIVDHSQHVFGSISPMTVRLQTPNLSDRVGGHSIEPMPNELRGERL